MNGDGDVYNNGNTALEVRDNSFLSCCGVVGMVTVRTVGTIQHPALYDKNFAGGCGIPSTGGSGNDYEKLTDCQKPVVPLRQKHGCLDCFWSPVLGVHELCPGCFLEVPDPFLSHAILEVGMVWVG